MTAAFLAFLTLLQADPGQRIAAAPAPESLKCPDILGEFTLEPDSHNDTFCAYAHPEGADARIWLQDFDAAADTPSDRVATLLDRKTPPPFAGHVLHLGESEAGDMREEVWRAHLGAREILIRSRYGIPGFSRTPLVAFGNAFIAANKLAVPAPEDAQNDVECPAAPGGFAIAERLSGAQTGAAVRWSCAYLDGDIYGFYYAPAQISDVKTTFDAQLSVESEAIPVPESMPKAVHMVLDKGTYRGVWARGTGEESRALELDWTSEAESADAARLVHALGF